MQNATLFGIHFAHFFQNTKKCSSDGLILQLPHILPRIMKMSLSKSKNVFKTLLFAAEKNRLKPTIWPQKSTKTDYLKVKKSTKIVDYLENLIPIDEYNKSY